MPSVNQLDASIIEEEDQEPAKPLSQTLLDLQLESQERENISEDGMSHRVVYKYVNDMANNDFVSDRERSKARFFVHCSQCNELCAGKLRVRCSECKGGAFTVYRDPENWDDVLKPRRIHGLCENSEVACTYGEQGGLPFAEFYFKCAKHTSEGEKDFAAPLNLIKCNIKNVPCLACTDVSDTVLVFSCDAGHVTCLDCFRTYCLSRLMERQFIPHPDFGYTLACPAGCENSFINEVHHFKLLTKEQYERYQRFATEEYVLQAGGVLCPQPGCGMGLLVDEDCTKVQCLKGCGVSLCRKIPSPQNP